MTLFLVLQAVCEFTHASIISILVIIAIIAMKRQEGLDSKFRSCVFEGTVKP